MRSLRLRGGIVSLGLVFFAIQVYGQEPDFVISSGDPIVEFSRAGRLAVAPDGRLFVTDRDRNTLLIFTRDGTLQQRVGGPGTEEGQFYDPVDIDPGIGLVYSVADGQNGRIQRFSKEFRFLESLPVPVSSDGTLGEDDPSFRTGTSGVQWPSNSRPVAVTSSAADDLYVVEAQAHVVIRWDRDRRQRWIIGQDSGAPFSLIDPVDLVTNSRFLFVADSGCDCIVVFDLFGTFIRIIAEGRLSNIKTVDRTPNGIVVVTGHRLIEFTEDGRRLRDIEVMVQDDLIDAAYHDGRFILLTEHALYLVSE